MLKVEGETYASATNPEEVARRKWRHTQSADRFQKKEESGNRVAIACMYHAETGKEGEQLTKEENRQGKDPIIKT